MRLPQLELLFVWQAGSMICWEIETDQGWTRCVDGRRGRFPLPHNTPPSPTPPVTSAPLIPPWCQPSYNATDAAEIEQAFSSGAPHLDISMRAHGYWITFDRGEPALPLCHSLLDESTPDATPRRDV